MSEMKYDPSMFEKLDESEKNDEAIAMESKTFLQDSVPTNLQFLD